MRSIARMSLLILLLALSGTVVFGLEKQDTKKAPLQGSTAAMLSLNLQLIPENGPAHYGL